MKISWPNVINILLLLIIVLMFLGVLDTRGSVKISDQISGFMKQSNARAALVIDGNGRVNSVNENGEKLTPCSVGPGSNQCKGLGIGGTVLTSELFNMLTVRGSGCVTLIGGDGQAEEWCWE